MQSKSFNRYCREGFVLKKALFSASEMDEVRKDAEKIFILQMQKQGIERAFKKIKFEERLFNYFNRDLKGFVSCAKQAQQLLSLNKLCFHPRIVNTLKSLGLQFPVMSKYPTMYFNSKYLATKEHYWRQAAHQDWRFLQGSLDSVVVWVALVDIDRSLGALQVIPRSHRWGLLESNVDENYGRITENLNTSKFISIEVKKGDALFFSAFLVHRSGNNVTRSVRWSCHFRYNNLSETSFIERGFPLTHNSVPIKHLISKNFPTIKDLRTIFE